MITQSTVKGEGDAKAVIHREDQMNVRRLEALRRQDVVERTPDGAFHLPADYAERVLRVEGRGGRESAKLDMLDPHPPDKQAAYRGPTWRRGQEPASL